ncbi:MAG: GPW/gp25 family protein [Lawsonibacter sp.]|nr:GPW/gp25 family protein [Lawsonibacter sp.]
MEWKLTDGDYVPDGTGGLTALSGGEEVLARVLYRLTARRGALPFLPQLGSRLYQLGRERPSARQALATQYVAEALRAEPNLTVQSVELDQAGDTGTLTVRLDWKGEALTVQVRV